MSHALACTSQMKVLDLLITELDGRGQPQPLHMTRALLCRLSAELNKGGQRRWQSRRFWKHHHLLIRSCEWHFLR